jgi:hypothetical protein
MTDNERQFEDFIRDIKFDDTPDPTHRGTLEQDLLTILSKQSPRQIEFWRTIMKAKITKLAAAAVIIVAVALSVSVLTNLTSPAWAIEDTAEALDEFSGIYISGTIAKGDLGEGSDTVLIGKERVPCELWAQANQERTGSGNIRLDAGSKIMVVYKMTTYTYDADSNRVDIKPGQGFTIDPWPTGEFVLQIQEMVKDWEVLYGKDPASGRDRVFITCCYPRLLKSYWFEIDVETGLPVRLKQWHNTRRQGAPAYDFQRLIFFEELPDELFEFDIPEGTTIIEK